MISLSYQTTLTVLHFDVVVNVLLPNVPRSLLFIYLKRRKLNYQGTSDIEMIVYDSIQSRENIYAIPMNQ